ncbi:lipopolysaccharide transport system ATP-binding protein [Microbulbifer thermotolerans]|uniref:ABC transporter ATP-binding protein n=1 Tax=Microbulbifer thermotolerans TaxID=252514 RepID=UPI0008EDD932|nr:ATP-binding cassette domain-containing protein [Microbulbifer thermotolerans]MCX2794491.1 ATP-binding cassette domain-containing protein [Microbulbifer thermotolerans]SFB89770.1 lipopolysaccharide transport system ATP-binding protein [Microbulbifer thermotolerans]
MDVVIQLRNVSYEYTGGFSLFDKEKKYSPFRNVNFDIYKGECLGIEGRNGAGKSTLLRIIAGILKPTCGEIRNYGFSTALLSLGLAFDPNVSGRKNTILYLMLTGFSKKIAESIAEEVKDFSDLNDFFEKPVKFYSSGMRARLGFSVMINTNADVLLIDEALAVGDSGFRKKSNAKMLEKVKSGSTVVLVSHNKNDINLLCDRSIKL